MTATENSQQSLSLLSVVIPAYNEEECICSTVEHVHVELRIHNVPHEIVAVDDGSTDNTWELLVAMQGSIPELVPARTKGPMASAEPLSRGSIA